jgi:enamine deaminase RidA (YjgF/YER057c/UK114 family)
MKILQPSDWPKPKGYSNGVESSGKIIFVAGQIGWTKDQKMCGNSIVSQTEQALINVCSVLSEANATAGQITRMTWYVVDKQDYKKNEKEIGAVYRSVIGSHYPAMSLIEVKSLLEDDALIEIEVTAVIPD